MSKLDEIIRTVALMKDPRSETEAKQQIKDLVIAICFEADEPDSPLSLRSYAEIMEGIESL